MEAVICGFPKKVWSSPSPGGELVRGQGGGAPGGNRSIAECKSVREIAAMVFPIREEFPPCLWVGDYREEEEENHPSQGQKGKARLQEYWTT